MSYSRVEPSPRCLSLIRDSHRLAYFSDLDQASNQLLQLCKKMQLNDFQNNFYKFETPLVFTPPPPPFPFLNIPPIVVQKDLFKEWGKIYKHQDADIPEDSIYRKLLACIPVVGIIPTVINENSLRKKIKQTEKSSYLVKLITVKNHYKISSIIRDLLSLALIVTGVALTILSWPIGIGAGMVGCSYVVINAYGIHKNKQIINKLRVNDLHSSDIDVR